MDYLIKLLDRLTKVVDFSPARDCHPLALEGVQAVLEMEEADRNGQEDGGFPRRSVISFAECHSSIHFGVLRGFMVSYANLGSMSAKPLPRSTETPDWPASGSIKSA